MFLLKKLFDIREKVQPGHEKSFVGHLEDLRRFVTRIVVTLILSMLVCFIFQAQLLDFLRGPVDRLWTNQQESLLPGKKSTTPRPINLNTWERAKQVEHATVGLTSAERLLLQQSLNDENLVFHAETVSELKASQSLSAEKRNQYLASLDNRPELKKQVLALLETGADTRIDPRGNISLMSALRPTETFMLSMKISFFAGIIFSLPLLLLYTFQFILPGFDKIRRRVVWPAVGIGFGLFLLGACFAYFGVLPRALAFFHDWSLRLEVANDWRIGEYISFALNMTLIFGLAFEMPVIVMILVKLGLLDFALMSRTRKYAITIIFIGAAVFTPPDPFTQLVLALPMIVLYEICIWLAWFNGRRQNKQLLPAT